MSRRHKTAISMAKRLAVIKPPCVTAARMVRRYGKNKVLLHIADILQTTSDRAYWTKVDEEARQILKEEFND